MCRVMGDPCVLREYRCGLIPSGWQLVVAAVPRPASLLYSIPGLAGGGFYFHEAAGRRSLRRFVPPPAEVFLLPAMVAGVFPARRVHGACAPAGGFECEVLFHK